MAIKSWPILAPSSSERDALTRKIKDARQQFLLIHKKTIKEMF